MSRPSVRAGLLCGPHDNVFRLPWWVRRIAAGGRVPAPGTPDAPVQLVDVRDLAAWMLDLRAPGPVPDEVQRLAGELEHSRTLHVEMHGNLVLALAVDVLA